MVPPLLGGPRLLFTSFLSSLSPEQSEELKVLMSILDTQKLLRSGPEVSRSEGIVTSELLGILQETDGQTDP